MMNSGGYGAEEANVLPRDPTSFEYYATRNIAEGEEILMVSTYDRRPRLRDVITDDPSFYSSRRALILQDYKSFETNWAEVGL